MGKTIFESRVTKTRVSNWGFSKLGFITRVTKTVVLNIVDNKKLLELDDVNLELLSIELGLAGGDRREEKGFSEESVGRWSPSLMVAIVEVGGIRGGCGGL